MKYRTYITTAILGAAAVIGVFLSGQGINVLKIDTNQFKMSGIVNALMVFFVIAILIERACEVLVKIFTVFRIIDEKDDQNNEVKRYRFMISTAICLALSSFVTISGLRLTSNVIEVVASSNLPSISFDPIFLYTDIIVTILILTGGSDGIHQIIERIQQRP